MGACGDALSMDNAQYGAHIEELAEQIKTVAADKIAEEYERAEAVTDRQLDREVAGGGMSTEEFRSYVRDIYLTWVPDMFFRATMVPYHEHSLTLANEVATISGSGALSGDEPPRDGYLPGVNFTYILAGGGLLGNEAFSHIPTIQTGLAPWTTAAVDRFRDGFLPNIAVALTNHMAVAKTLRNVMAANYHMLALAREDIDGIAHDTIAALESSDGCCPWDTSDPKANLGVAAGVGTIIAGFVTFPVAPPFGAEFGAAAVASGFTVLDGSVTAWSAIEESRAEAQGVPLGADTVDGILENMAAALNTVYGKLDEGSDALRGGLSALAEQMADNRLACLAPRPVTFAEATQDNVVEIVEGGSR